MLDRVCLHVWALGRGAGVQIRPGIGQVQDALSDREPTMGLVPRRERARSGGGGKECEERAGGGAVTLRRYYGRECQQMS